MTTIELDDEASIMLGELVEKIHITPTVLIKRILAEYLEDYQDATLADAAYRKYLDSGEISYSLDSVVKEIGI